jgi:alkyldihydroxyacetonephosphate synthase
VEFSTLGGWISTRASGMKKNVYGNIEDIILNVKIVTPIGTFQKGSDCPRVSSGPDINHFIMGSEGSMGIITEAIIRVRDMPKVRKYGSIIFPDFDTGVNFMYEMSKTRVWPASVRLVDNTQFQFAMSLKPEEHSKTKELLEAAKKYYLTQIKGFDLTQIAVVTVLFEGEQDLVDLQEKTVYAVASRNKGLKAGEESFL